ncbi:MAG TPA: L-histidine N(alpha)-methyltransferase [Gemmatimonadaceae bacterium]|nr:L-histidine N(alpha)-methyltransferase [Gemmatimonadaceae bacterium]
MSDTSLAVKCADPAMLAEVREGLLRAQKEISPKYFYDHRGSLLFEAITRLPEYYLTRTERALLTRVAPALARSIGPRSLVELGAGSADKTRIVLDALHPESLVYVPVDVSAAFLDETATRLRAEYPGLHVEPVVADLSDDAPGARPFAPRSLPHPTLVAFLGSTIGNFDDDAAVRLLRRVRGGMRVDDRLLLGADLVKDVAVIEAAYNDAQGVTAEFNRNMLRVLNHELGATFDPDAFEHWAFYNAAAGRIEMHLVADADQCVGIPGVGTIPVRRGESIRTEVSNKYDRPRLTRMLLAADLDIAEWETDDAGGYALVVARPCA